jgi:hypothetical protein
MTDKKILAVGASAMAVAYEPSRGLVVAMFDLPRSLTHLVEDLSLAVQLSPTEARQLAGMLIRKADEAEGGPTNQTLEAKTYSPLSIRTAMTEDGQKTILFDLPGVGAVALALPDDGLRFLMDEVSKLLAPPH